MLEERIEEWRSYLRRRQAIDLADVEELEDHLRTQVGELREAGLDDEEAFLIAVKRIGELDELSREFAREYSERLWKRLVLAPEAEEAAGEGRKEIGSYGCPHDLLNEDAHFFMQIDKSVFGAVLNRIGSEQ